MEDKIVGYYADSGDPLTEGQLLDGYEEYYNDLMADSVPFDAGTDLSYSDEERFSKQAYEWLRTDLVAEGAVILAKDSGKALGDKPGESERDDKDCSKLKAWEDFCEGTYPGYGDTELEARAYASLTEVLDEAKPLEVMALMVDRFAWAGDMLLQHKAYEEDERITKLVKLLLHHGWEPPVLVDYMSVTRRKELHPSDLEELDFGAAMEELAGGYDRDHDHPHSSAS